MIQAVLNTRDTEAIQLTLDRLPLEYVSPLGILVRYWNEK